VYVRTVWILEKTIRRKLERGRLPRIAAVVRCDLQELLTGQLEKLDN